MVVRPHTLFGGGPSWHRVRIGSAFYGHSSAIRSGLLTVTGTSCVPVPVLPSREAIVAGSRFALSNGSRSSHRIGLPRQPTLQLYFQAEAEECSNYYDARQHRHARYCRFRRSRLEAAHLRSGGACDDAVLALGPRLGTFSFTAPCAYMIGRVEKMLAPATSMSPLIGSRRLNCAS